MKNTLLPWLRHAFRFGFAALFTFAAIPKLADPAAFARDIEGFRLLPPLAVYLAALALPWMELLIAVVLLAVPRLRLGAWTFTVAFLAIFTVALGSAAARGLDIRCGCFGGNEAVGAKDAALRAVLTILAICGFLIDGIGAAGLAAKDRSKDSHA
jgi:hypothetical protein